MRAERVSLDMGFRSVNTLFAAALDDARQVLMVANAGSNDISVIDLRGKKQLARLEVGANPRGIVFEAQSDRAYVNNVLDGTISVIDMQKIAVIESIRITEIPLDPQILLGKQLFHNARVPDLTTDRWISCAVCHFDGGMDGRTWLGFPDGPRNTPSLFGVGRTPPVHWSGDLDELQDVELTIRNIQAGTGLVEGEAFDTLGPPHTGLSAELDALAAFMASLKVPRSPYTIPPAEFQRGEKVFAQQGCETCHPAPLYTDMQLHDVGTGNPQLERNSHGRGTQFDTPSLLGIWATAPYFHDGSAQTLVDVFRMGNEHNIAERISERDLQYLLSFLFALPSDYLTLSNVILRCSMRETTFSIRAILYLLLLGACTTSPEPVLPSPAPTSTLTATSSPTAAVEPPPKVELDEIFYSNPRRLGEAAQAHEQMRTPEASLISLNLVEGEYLVEVVAAPGAVPPNARVVIANIETLAFKLITADDEGGFRVEVQGYPGAHILIKQDSTGSITAFDSDENMSHAEFILAPGAIMQIPFESRDDGSIPVATGFCCDHFDSSWIFKGSISSDHLQAGERFAWEGKITLFSDTSDAPEPSTFLIHATYLSDEAGRQVGSADQFISSLLTPTGLAIERTWGSHPLGPLVEVPLSWQKEGDTWKASVSGEAEIPADFRDGRYILLAWIFYQAQSRLPGMNERLSPRCCNGERLAILEVGDPAPTRLAATLLADTLSEGSRGGVIAQEDKGMFEFSTRAVTHHNPVIPRLDAFGTPWSYQLGPFLPMVGGVDRHSPAKPAIDFDFSSGDLTIHIQRPDGGVDVIGPSPITRLGSNTPRTPWFDDVSRGGGSLGEVPQLLGEGEAFAYQFPMDGDYLITLDGKIKDILGNDYEISGTYPVMVADVLDIEPALLPGTPFEVGDHMPISLYVMPGLPAEVVYKLTTYHPDGEMEVDEYTGKANAFGWWDGGGQSHLFERPGEYLVEVEARFEGGGNLWVGRMTFGGVIASPNPAIAMHGRRGPDGLMYLAPVWSFDTDYGAEERAHFNLPYFSGDILWGTPRYDPALGLIASEAAVVRSSIQILDPANPLVQKALAQVRQFGGYQESFSLSQMEIGDQIPLITSADPSWWNVGIHPDEIDFWAYLYNSVERPGVRVREIARGSDVSVEYWRFDDGYHLQSGNGIEGDLPGDFKFIYGGAVLRDENTGEGEYAIYGSGWVHTEYDDPLGGRVMPPFQGAAGGPSGGPLFAIFDTPIDIFFVPLAVRPGMVLEAGEAFRMAGPIMPTLPSKLEYTVTAPDGSRRTFGGVANAVGYYYQPGDDFTLDQTGEWLVELTVTHNGMTSAGPVEEPYPTGGPLTPDLHTFSFFVVESAKDRLPVYTDLSELDLQPWHYEVDSAAFVMMLPEDLEADKVRMVATIPGIVMASEEIAVEDGRVAWTLVGPTLNRLVHNLDHLRGLADTITVTFFAQDSERAVAGSLVLHGWHVPLPPAPLQTPLTYPAPKGETILVKNIADSGPGTLRQALLEAARYDVITFDTAVFPPDAPATIPLSSGLPALGQGNLTIDASNAGVILDGSHITTPEFVHGIVISSDNNIIRGLQIVGFSDAGIALVDGAQYNIIGGDPSIGNRRFGQSNLINGNGAFGIGLWGEDTSHNTIQGNIIGINMDGTASG
ncbi:MAG TPA: cytochrome c peroxidase, partial [Anaerolineales bacterium]|nr:cytochrome c peroxidase [Anaerolineales bacterium]